MAQLARRIAEGMTRSERELATFHGLDADAAEAAALAHDLGHPPFGHIAEDELNKRIKLICKDDGYEGNAQSFRLVTNTSVGDAEDSDGLSIDYGLNLTRTTLNGILKYPWKFGGNPEKPNKWGCYLTEQKEFDWTRIGCAAGKKSLEAEIMDWSDDITYAVHDLFDFYCANKIPLERLVSNKQETEMFLGAYFHRYGISGKEQTRYTKAFERFLKRLRKAITRSYSGTRIEQRSVWGRMTILITEYVSAISMNGHLDSPATINQDAQDEVNIAKQLTWHYVIMNNELATSQHGQRKIVGDLFDLLYEAASSKNNLKLFPKAYEQELSRQQYTEHQTIRIVADYISGMTEKEVTSVYKKIHGIEHGRMV